MTTAVQLSKKYEETVEETPIFKAEGLPSSYSSYNVLLYKVVSGNTDKRKSMHVTATRHVL